MAGGRGLGQAAMAPAQRGGSCWVRRVPWGFCKPLLAARLCPLRRTGLAFSSHWRVHGAERFSRCCWQGPEEGVARESSKGFSPPQQCKEEEALGLGHFSYQSVTLWLRGNSQSRCSSPPSFAIACLHLPAFALPFPYMWFCIWSASTACNCPFHRIVTPSAFGTYFSWLI